MSPEEISDVFEKILRTPDPGLHSVFPGATPRGDDEYFSVYTKLHFPFGEAGNASKKRFDDEYMAQPPPQWNNTIYGNYVSTPVTPEAGFKWTFNPSLNTDSYNPNPGGDPFGRRTTYESFRPAGEPFMGPPMTPSSGDYYYNPFPPAGDPNDPFDIWFGRVPPKGYGELLDMVGNPIPNVPPLPYWHTKTIWERPNIPSTALVPYSGSPVPAP